MFIDLVRFISIHEIVTYDKQGYSDKIIRKESKAVYFKILLIKIKNVVRKLHL